MRLRERDVRFQRRRMVAAIVGAVLALGLLPAGADVSVVAQDPPDPVCPPGLFASKGASPANCSSTTTTSDVEALALPSGFTESIVFSGLTNPTAIEFAADGRVFVAEKSGVIKIYDSLADPTPTSSAAFTERPQLSGIAASSASPWTRASPPRGHRPLVYVLYAYDHILGSRRRRLGGATRAQRRRARRRTAASSAAGCRGSRSAAARSPARSSS